MIENPYDIPPHWQVKKLGEVCETGSGGTPLKKHNEYYEGGTIPWLLSGEIRQGEIIESKNFITEQGLKNSSAKLFPKDTVLIAMYGATAGQVGILRFQACTNQAVCGIFPNKKTIPEFLYYCFLSKKEELVSQAEGGAQPNISQLKIRTTPIPLPPLPEQEAIVAKIEELFSELEKGKQLLLTAQEQLKVYRQSLLKWAFEGKLTNNNLPDGQLPDGWKWVKLVEIAKKITDGEHFRPKTQEKGIPFLSAKDVKNNGVSFDEPLYISEETAKKAMLRCNPEKGDILIVSRGATVGRMCIVNTNIKFCLLGSVILIKVNNEKIDGRLLNYILKSPIANQNLITVSGATAQQAIYLRDIKNIKLPLPPLTEQEHIVEILESKLSVCDSIEQTLKQTLQQVETLRQSILKKAFEGKLVKTYQER